MACIFYPEQPFVPARAARIEQSPSFDWNAGANSEDSLSGNVRFGFTVPKVIGVVLGLTPDRSNVIAPARITHGFAFQRDGTGANPVAVVYEGGAPRGTPTPYVPNSTLFEIRRVGTSVFYFRDGVRVYSSFRPSSGTVSAGTALFATADAAPADGCFWTDIVFGVQVCGAVGDPLMYQVDPWGADDPQEIPFLVGAIPYVGWNTTADPAPYCVTSGQPPPTDFPFVTMYDEQWYPGSYGNGEVNESLLIGRGALILTEFDGWAFSEQPTSASLSITRVTEAQFDPDYISCPGEGYSGYTARTLNDGVADLTLGYSNGILSITGPITYPYDRTFIEDYGTGNSLNASIFDYIVVIEGTVNFGAEVVDVRFATRNYFNTNH